MANQGGMEIKEKVDSICNLYRLSPEDKEDISQDIILKLLDTNWGKIENRDDYIFIIARNQITDFIRKETRDEKLIEQLKEREILRSQVNDNDDHIEGLRIAFEEELENLPPQQKKIMEMIYGGVSQQQIAVELKISEGAVRNQLSIARKKIQNKVL